MLAWIAIYSLFESVDFIYEVVVLFADITFWGSVFLSVIIALGALISSSPISLETCLLCYRSPFPGQGLQQFLLSARQGHRA